MHEPTKRADNGRLAILPEMATMLVAGGWMPPSHEITSLKISQDMANMLEQARWRPPMRKITSLEEWTALETGAVVQTDGRECWAKLMNGLFGRIQSCHYEVLAERDYDDEAIKAVCIEDQSAVTMFKRHTEFYVVWEPRTR